MRPIQSLGVDLLLIRHGLPVRIEDADGPADPPLSDLGHAQSKALAAWLTAADERTPVDVIVSSPLRRAVETAAPLAEATGHVLTVDESISEFDRHANFYVPIEEMKAEGDPRWHALAQGDYTALVADGPAIDVDVFRREVVDGLNAIAAANPGLTVAAVCHGGVINAFVADVLGIDQTLFFEPTYTGVTRLRISRTGIRSIVSVNETGHLRGVTA